MAVYLRSLATKGSPFIFEIRGVYSKIIYGSFMNKNIDKIPALFEAQFLVDADGKTACIQRDDLRWFHFEDKNKLIIFDNFYLPHYVRQGDRLLYLE